MNEVVDLAFIGGSGLYEIDGITTLDTISCDTPFGNPSGEIVVGEISNRLVAFLPRHGIGHELSPSEVPYAANIYALKSLGVKNIISMSAVGSLQESLSPGCFVLPDQLIDRTHKRKNTFFDEGVVAHVSMADPFCSRLTRCVNDQLDVLGITNRMGGTYIAIEGPHFSTRAESHLYKSWGASIIGMTASPEVKLAREAEICFVTVAMVTDYDCWKGDTVSTEMVLESMSSNSKQAKELIVKIGSIFSESPDCGCRKALQGSLINKNFTDGHPAKLLIQKYISL